MPEGPKFQPLNPIYRIVSLVCSIVGGVAAIAGTAFVGSLEDNPATWLYASLISVFVVSLGLGFLALKHEFESARLADATEALQEQLRQLRGEQGDPAVMKRLEAIEHALEELKPRRGLLWRKPH